MREAERVKLAGLPLGQAIVVALARGIARLSARIRAPRANFGPELDDHAPARAGGPVSSRWVQRAGSGLHGDVEPRERRNAQQMMDVRVPHIPPAPRGARLSVLLDHALVSRELARAQNHVAILHDVSGRAVVPPRALRVAQQFGE